MATSNVKNFDNLLKIVDLVFKLLGIFVTIYLFWLGNEIKKEQDRYNTEQKGFDRAITLLKSYVSDNASERYLAIKYSELLNQRDSFPDEIIIYVKNLLSKDTVKENIEAANELIHAVNLKAESRNDTTTLNLITTELNRIQPTVYIHIRDANMRSTYEQLIRILNKEDLSLPGIQRVTANYSTTELKYFKKSERQKAEEIVNILKKASKDLPEAGLQNLRIRYLSGYEDSNKLRPFHFELYVK